MVEAEAATGAAMKVDPWQNEQERQSQELANILQAEINAFGDRLLDDGKQPLLNAVASALVSVTGAMLASVEDKRIRKELRRVMERGLPRAVAAHDGKSGRSQIIVHGRSDA